MRNAVPKAENRLHEGDGWAERVQPDLRTRTVAVALPLLRVLHRVAPAAIRRLLRDLLIRRYVAWRPITVSFRTPDGLRIEGPIRDVIVSTLYFEGQWEPALRRLLRAQLRREDVFVDVGANFGIHALFASRRVGPGGVVYAIEASPGIYARLLRHVALNAADNVVALNVAASDRPGQVMVHRAVQENSGASTIVDDAEELARRGATPETEVQAKPLWQIVPESLWPRIAAIKIDVEGAEALVVRGLEPMLDALPERVMIIVELSRGILQRRFGLTVADVLAPFRARGLVAHAITEHGVSPDPVGDQDIPFNAWDTAEVVLVRRLP